MIERIGVVGCGLMGSGIAEVSARAGLDVIVHEVNEERVATGRHRIESSLGRAVRSAKLDPEARDRALDRLRFTTDLGSFADRDLLVEAVSEDEATRSPSSGASTGLSRGQMPCWRRTPRRSPS